MTPSVLALAVLGWAVSGADARELARVYGPLRVAGEVQPMMGPRGGSSERLDKPGWIRSFSVRVLDASKRPAGQRGLLCHAAMDLSSTQDESELQKLGFNWYGALTLSGGLERIEFPEGYGLRIGTGPFKIEGMLQNSDPAVREDFFVEAASEISETPLKTLQYFRIGMGEMKGSEWTPPEGAQKRARPGHWHHSQREWSVPSGRHEYRKRFVMPYSGRIKFMHWHLHEHAVSVRLMEASSDRPAYEGKVIENDRRQLVALPAYSDHEGIRVEAGKTYEFSAVYDNPLRETISAMATMHVFLYDD